MDQDSHPKLLAYYRDEFFGRLRPNTVDKLQGVPIRRFFPTEPGSRQFTGIYHIGQPEPHRDEA